ncbi:transcription factor Ouib-like isoform X4 [Helicoverpa zea]|uniref:transcription factor Ouib-like isoform X4 n=1 Tax=Helicoverpa zea TaxID=7113 RepID=UPI001F56F77E|nr:transcription factor Ouib-like isoform X4 [Helicoverpa zea]
MSVCRTCLSKDNLNNIFSDKNLISLHTQNLFLVCGVKIEENDGLSQLMCNSCSNIVNSALKLRELSAKSEEILKKTIKIESELEIQPQPTKIDTKHKNKKDMQNSNKELQRKNKNSQRVQQKVCTKRSFDAKNDDDFKDEFSVRIEDFESSNDSDFMKSFLIDDLESINSENEQKVCIEDYESSDSVDDDFKNIIKKDNKIDWDVKEKGLLEKGRRKLLCKDCGRKFVNPSHMRYHQQRVHGKTKRLACSHCSYRAVDPMALRNHIRAEHTGERPFVCDVCGENFRMRANIAQHMRIHGGVKNLQCERCPAMFRSRSELTGHQNRVHYMIYTYPCYLCTESYKKLDSVKKHLLNIHGVPRDQQLPIKCIKRRRRSCDKSD